MALVKTVKGNVIHFVPNVQQALDVQSRWDISSLTLEEVSDELVVGHYLILEGLPHCRYRFIEKVDAIGFIANLRLRVAESKRGDTRRLTSMDQYYDLEMTSKGNRCVLRDLAQVSHPTIELDLAAFKKSIDQCAAAVFQTMLCLFPELGRRKDIDQLRGILGAAKRR